MRSVRVFLLIGVVLVASGLVLPTNLHAQSPTTFDEYRQAVAQALALVQQAEAQQPAERSPLLNQAADLLQEIKRVQTPSGAVVNVDNADIVALIRDPARPDLAIQRLTNLRDALAVPLAEISPADLATLKAMLANPPFVQTGHWYDSILRAIEEFLSRLFGNAARGVFDFRDLLILVAIVVVIGVLVYFVRNLRRNLVSEEALPPELLAQEARTPAEAFDNAQRFVNAGDYRSAVRQLYLATLLILDQHGRIKYDPTLTNREYLAQTSNDARTTAALKPIVETFDRTWYGFEPISLQEFDAYRQRVEKVREL